MITSDAPFFHLSFYSRWCWDTEAHIQNVTEYFISSGLAKLGYVHINIDEGWLKGRDNATGTRDLSNASHASPLFFPPTQPTHCTPSDDTTVVNGKQAKWLKTLRSSLPA